MTRWSMRALLVLLVVLVAGCGEDCRDVYWVDVPLQSRIGILEDAAEEWCHVTDGERCVRWTTTYGQTDNIIRIGAPPECAGEHGCAGQFSIPPGVDITPNRTILLFLASIDTDDALRAVVLHELGHHIGCEHIPVVASIMYERIDPDISHLTVPDALEWCRTSHCSEIKG